MAKWLLQSNTLLQSKLTPSSQGNVARSKRSLETFEVRRDSFVVRATSAVCESDSAASTSHGAVEKNCLHASNSRANLGLPPSLLPKHVAKEGSAYLKYLKACFHAGVMQIIMDGNARWAESHHLPRYVGHEAGVHALRRTVSCCLQWRIPALTVFAFSAENWLRPNEEMQFLMKVIEHELRSELDTLTQKGIRLRILGNKETLPVSLQHLLTRVEAETAGNTTLDLNVALSYGGRQDITQATRSIAQEVAHGNLRVSEVTEELISARLGLGQLREEIRHPDLLIRSSGEMRLSNFLLWEIAYSELYFTRTRWPDFGEADFRAALHDFCARQRRYGQRM